MNSSEAHEWFQKHPSGVLWDSEGGLWRRTAAGVDQWQLRGHDWGPSFFKICAYKWLAFEPVALGVDPAAPASDRMSWEEAKAWMLAHPGEELIDDIATGGGDRWRTVDGVRYFLRHGRESEGWHESRWEYESLTFQVAPKIEPVTPAPIATIGVALDWLIAHPGEQLVDSEGDLWRINQDEDRVELLHADWVEPSLLQPEGLTWRPAEPLRVLPELPTGRKWKIDNADGLPYASYGSGYIAVRNDDEAAVLEALLEEYRNRRAK